MPTTKKNNPLTRPVILFLSFYLLWAGLCQPLFPQLRTVKTPQDEKEVKSYIIIRMIELAEWPENSSAFTPGTPFKIGIVGDEDILPYLKEAIKKKNTTINNKPLDVIKISGLPEVTQCQVIFFTSNPDEQFNEVLKLIEALPILTISDSLNEEREKIMIHLFIKTSDPENVRFSVTRSIVKKSGISLTSKILRYAEEIYD